MKLEFRKPHLSILEFPSIDVPSFIVITGVNGAGKTHLLKAIADGSIATNVAPKPAEEVRLFDWRTMVPNAEGATTEAELFNDPSGVFRKIKEVRYTHQASLALALRSFTALGAAGGRAP